MTNAEATSRAIWTYAEKYANEEFKDVKMLAVHVHGPGQIFTRDARHHEVRGLQGQEAAWPNQAGY